jgi:DNA-binding beta-propeller fold protein YncE
MTDCKGHDTKTTCIECEIPQLARNHFFTGKLLVERDFVDEQRYFVGKDRRHNQQLHGWGTVCGLKVKQHPNEACQDTYVLIEPGTAIDCCGREILVRREEYFDFRARLEEIWKEQKGAEAVPDDQKHTLQICLRYTECGTEEVPALFSECGCDDTACQPNRTSESYQFELLLDPPPLTDEADGHTLKWSNTINVANSDSVAVHAGSERVYVMSSDLTSTLYAFNSVNQQLLGSHVFPDRKANWVAVSPDGMHLYLVLNDTAASTQELVVLKADDLAGAPVNTIAIPGNATVYAVVVAPDGRVFGNDVLSNRVLVWGTDINTQGSPAPPAEVTVGQNPLDIVIAQNGEHVYTANKASGDVSAIKVSDLSVISIPVEVNARPVSLAAASTTAGDNLAVVNEENAKLHFIAWRPDEANPADRVKPLGSPVGFDFPPLGVVMSPGGKWVYVLKQGNPDYKRFVLTVNVHAVTLGQPDQLGAQVPVGDNASKLLLTDDGRRLYLPFEWNQVSGVSIVDVIENDCKDIINRVLDDCPTCEEGDCIVLATIKDYVYGYKVVDGAPQSGQAQIDNLTGRRLLPSTTIISEMVQCLLEAGPGAALSGPQGPPGLAGLNGASIKTVDAESVASNQAAEAIFTEATGNLHLKIPKGEAGTNGTPGTPGMNGTSVETVEAHGVASNQPASATYDPATGHLDLFIPKGEKGDPANQTIIVYPHIVAINWPHNGYIVVNDKNYKRLQKDGLVIAFDQDVKAKTLHKHSFEVLISTAVERESGYDLYCYCYVNGIVTGTKTVADCDGLVSVDLEDITDGPARAGRFRPSKTVQKDKKPPSQTEEQVLDWLPGEYRVIIRGNFIIGDKKIKLPDGRLVYPSVDADHMGPAIHASLDAPLDPDDPAKAIRRCPSGNMTEGGTFESWFSIRPKQ